MVQSRSSPCVTEPCWITPSSSTSTSLGQLLWSQPFCVWSEDMSQYRPWGSAILRPVKSQVPPTPATSSSSSSLLPRVSATKQSLPRRKARRPMPMPSVFPPSHFSDTACCRQAFRKCIMPATPCHRCSQIHRRSLAADLGRGDTVGAGMHWACPSSS